MVRSKRKWADVKDAVLGTKKEKTDEEDEVIESVDKGKPKKNAARKRSAPRQQQEKNVARPAALGLQSKAQAWTYSDEPLTRGGRRP